MSLPECLLVLVAGAFAGTINTVVGSGTLVTFPVLLAVGYSPVVANVSNTLGLVPGSVSGAIGYREELAGQRKRVLTLGSASVLGGIVGAILLLSLPPDAFETIVPVLIALALVLVIVQPRLSRMIAARRERVRPHGGPLLWTGVFGTGIYGGYFGAAQGVILLAITGIAIPEDLQRLNALKNVLAGAGQRRRGGDLHLLRLGRLAAGRAARGRLGGRGPARREDRPAALAGGRCAA